jgi:hypothetical protein
MKCLLCKMFLHHDSNATTIEIFHANFATLSVTVLHATYPRHNRECASLTDQL